MTKHLKDAERLRKIVEAFPKVTITVLGDLVADEFVFGEISRVSREAPVLILKHRERIVVPGGGAKGCDCTAPGGGAPGPGNGRLGVGSSRPCGNAGTSSSSSGCCWLPRGMLPGGRCTGSEKIVPICARAGGAAKIVVAATRAAKPVRAMVRNISCGFNGRIGLTTLYRGYQPLAGHRLTR